MADKKKRPTFTTPVGVGRYMWVRKPDTKFNAEGTYKVDLILEGKDAEKLKERIDGLIDEAWDEKTDGLGAAKVKKLSRACPYEAEEDDDGNETGRTIFKFKQNAVIKMKDGSKKKVKIAVFDAKGKPTEANPYSGSSVAVSFSTRPYLMESTKMVGITMDLLAVQIIELVSGGSRDGADYGFETHDDGFDEDDEDNESEDSSTDDSEDEEEF